MNIVINPGRLLAFLVGIIILLSILGLTVLLIGDFTGHYRIIGLGSLFNPGSELNIPTWFNSIELALCSILAWIIAKWKRRTNDGYARKWSILAMLLIIASLDEVASLHERSESIVKIIFPSGILHTLGWTIPMGLLVLFLSLYFLRFVLDLPVRIRRLVMLAGLLYVGGAIGMELLADKWASIHGGKGPVISIMVVLEEGFGEMLGIAILTYALAYYISGNMCLSFGKSDARNEVTVHDKE